MLTYAASSPSALENGLNMFMIVSLAVSGVCLLLLVVAFAWWRRKQHGYRRMRKRVQEMTVAVQDGGGWLLR